MPEVKTYVVKIGGSMISKDIASLIDVVSMKNLKEVVLRRNSIDGSKFFLITGGGAVARGYRDALMANGIEDVTGLHWVGTTVNVVHAMALMAVFGDAADKDVLKFEEYYQNTPLSIERIVKTGGGGRPGHSGDVDALIVAKRIGAEFVYSLKNIDGVYEADPKIVPSAKRIDHLSWEEYLNIIGNPDEHSPGANFPIDPIASRMARKEGKKFVVLAGNDLANFEKALSQEKFVGTIVG